MEIGGCHARRDEDGQSRLLHRPVSPLPTKVPYLPYFLALPDLGETKRQQVTASKEKEYAPGLSSIFQAVAFSWMPTRYVLQVL